MWAFGWAQLGSSSAGLDGAHSCVSGSHQEAECGLALGTTGRMASLWSTLIFLQQVIGCLFIWRVTSSTFGWSKQVPWPIPDSTGGELAPRLDGTNCQALWPFFCNLPRGEWQGMRSERSAALQAVNVSLCFIHSVSCKCKLESHLRLWSRTLTYLN